MIAEKILMGLLLSGVAFGCWLVLAPFMSALLWAGILVYTTWPVFSRLRANLGGRGTPAALAMVTLTAVIVVLPIALAAPGGTADVAELRQLVMDGLREGLPPAPDWITALPLAGPKLADLWNRGAKDVGQILEVIRPYIGTVLESGLAIVLRVANGVLMFMLALFIAFFMYVHGDPIAERMRAMLQRIAGDQADRLLTVTGATMRGVVYGVLGTAIVQGILTALGLWFCGVPRAMLLGFVAALCSVLPIGAPTVWIPAAIWLMAIGHWGYGIFLIVWGVGAISGADSVIRPWFIARGAHLPFLLTALGALGGALAFGLLGIFLGPVLLGVGYTLVAEWSR